jgi:hypothetical protein
VAINLKDIPDAVKDYLNTQVTVTITPFVPSAGTSVNPAETFTFDVKATNNGGIALKNVKYKVLAVNPHIAKVRVPAGGTATDLAGTSLAANAEVGAFIFDPSGSAFDLPAGDTDTVRVTGKAVSGASGGTTGIRASVLADIDLDQLFPKGEDTGTSQRTLTVVG